MTYVIVRTSEEAAQVEQRKAPVAVTYDTKKIPLFELFRLLELSRYSAENWSGLDEGS